MSAKCMLVFLGVSAFVACGADDSNNEIASSAGRDDAGAVIVPAGCDVKASPYEAAACNVDSYVVYVSSNGDDSASGTKSAPKKTMGSALRSTGPNRPRVYVCAGEYAERVEIKDQASGLMVVGGWDCATWTKGTAETHVAPSERGEALRIENATSDVSVRGIRFTSQDGVDPGESSICAIVSTSTNVMLTEVTLEAGKGVDGAKGADGAAGKVGEKGNDASGATPGASKAVTCDWGTTTGGAGGGVKAKGGDGSATPATTPVMGRDGTGGAAYDTTNSTPCVGGKAGADGSARAGGQGATVAGSVTSVWTPVAGEAGEAGNPGQGGGGGGGGDTDASGAGGLGGCGGSGGRGGGGGGGSIALLGVSATLSVSSSVMKTSVAGSGALGGTGGAGGGGGGGGGTTGACGGGRGGNGAGGTGGGGGAGGVSAGIAYKGTTPQQSNVRFELGAAGVAGTGGNGGLGGANGSGFGPAGPPGTAGIPGVASETYEIK